MWKTLGAITQETLENRVEVKDPNDAVYGGTYAQNRGNGTMERDPEPG
jgi:hypothetical protein